MYCGGSRTNVFSRVGQHSNSIEFDDAIWYPIPAALVFDYEGAFTRSLEPELNDNAPVCRGYDNEILEGFGLNPHVDPDAVARRWHLKRYAKTMVPRTKKQKESARRWRALTAVRKDSVQ